jgi:hypothetical protein
VSHAAHQLDVQSGKQLVRATVTSCHCCTLALVQATVKPEATRLCGAAHPLDDCAAVGAELVDQVDKLLISGVRVQVLDVHVGVGRVLVGAGPVLALQEGADKDLQRRGCNWMCQALHCLVLAEAPGLQCMMLWDRLQLVAASLASCILWHLMPDSSSSLVAGNACCLSITLAVLSCATQA